jgi:hypothetical protein
MTAPVETTAWLQAPSLAWRYAFDHCAVELARDAGPVALFASTPFYARELVRRISSAVVPCPTCEPGSASAEFLAAAGPELRPEHVGLADASDSGMHRRLGAIVWAEPENGTWQGVADQVAWLAAPGATLCILGRTARLHSLVRRRLQSLGFRLENCYGFQGPLSLALGMASRLPAQFGRDDLVDRCYAAMRQRLVVRGPQARWSSVWMLTGRF